MNRILLLLVLAMLGLSSCKVLNPSIMLRPGKSDTLSNFTNTAPAEYRIAANDIFEFALYTNEGNKLIDIGLIPNTNNMTQRITYLVDIDGFSKLPVLGRVKMSGLTIREAEKMLEERYEKFFVKPFVLLKVINRRVVIFPGEGGAAKVITLVDENTTLIEALAQAGGIPPKGKAHRIRLIRRTGEKMQIQLIDLSTLKSMPEANIVMQSNDIVYVEPAARYPQEILAAITPYVTLLTTLMTIYLIVDRNPFQ